MHLSFVLFLLPTAHAACVSNTTFSDVLDAVLQAEDAYRVLDRDLLEARVTFAETRLSCLGDPIGRDLAASFHRMEALHAFLKKDETSAALFFGAARSIMPAYKFPEDLVPADNYLQTLYTKLDLSTLTRETIPAAAEGKILFDGIETTERPKDVPTIFQILDSASMAAITQLVMPGAPLPYYKAAIAPPPEEPKEPLLQTLPLTPRKLVGTGLVVASLGGTAISTYNLLTVYSACHDNSNNLESCQSHVGPTWSNAVPWLVGGSLGLGLSLAGLGTGVTLLVTPGGAAVSGTF